MLIQTECGEICWVTNPACLTVHYFSPETETPRAELVAQDKCQDKGNEIQLTQAFPVAITHAVHGELLAALDAGEPNFDVPQSLFGAKRWWAQNRP